MLSDAEILDVVRRIRTYLATMDNCHLVLGLAQNIDDKNIVDQVTKLAPDLINVGGRMSQVLRQIETSKPYREMLKKFNIKEEDEDGGT
jgi:hypothetical protein